MCVISLLDINVVVVGKYDDCCCWDADNSFDVVVVVVVITITRFGFDIISSMYWRSSGRGISLRRMLMANADFLGSGFFK